MHHFVFTIDGNFLQPLAEMCQRYQIGSFVTFIILYFFAKYRKFDFFFLVNFLQSAKIYIQIKVLVISFLTDHLFSDFPNTSPYEGSGADPECFDDEDCFTEGSGSGVKNRYDDIEDNEGSGYSDDEDDDDEEEDTDEFEVQWPPWLNKDQKEDKPDIIFQDPRTTLRPRPNVVVQTTAGAGKVIAICLPVMLIHVARVLL